MSMCTACALVHAVDARASVAPRPLDRWHGPARAARAYTYAYTGIHRHVHTCPHHFANQASPCAPLSAADDCNTQEGKTHCELQACAGPDFGPDYGQLGYCTESNVVSWLAWVVLHAVLSIGCRASAPKWQVTVWCLAVVILAAASRSKPRCGAPSDSTCHADGLELW